ncbi:hypothetical protein SSOG_00406 [Streptomyces himastatinicus ATCC 53653]|uniref:Uncharacterized protein n=1 Tax=Streptomyces himastatinicus ATCC 53653 TaxID=457427 RepID=D9W9K6_9ACTN|nr:hypothetical protein SSOG_00406 [Streptomyces himastatinicus ATCC 53653]
MLPFAMLSDLLTLPVRGVSGLRLRLADAADVLRDTGERRTRRRVWAREGRAHVEVRGLTGHGEAHDRLAGELRAALHRLHGVNWAEGERGRGPGADRLRRGPSRRRRRPPGDRAHREGARDRHGRLPGRTPVSAVRHRSRHAGRHRSRRRLRGPGDGHGPARDAAARAHPRAADPGGDGRGPAAAARSAGVPARPRPHHPAARRVGRGGARADQG